MNQTRTHFEQSLRKSDVGRVLDETPEAYRADMAKWLAAKRPDLCQEVGEVMADFAEEAKKVAAKPIFKRSMPTPTATPEDAPLDLSEWAMA